MKYLFGDSSPFPLAENFLLTARAATEACVALLRADELAAEGRRAIRESEVRATQELARLEALGRRIDEVFVAHPPTTTVMGPGDAASTRIGELARAQLDQARTEVLRWKDSAVAASTKAAPLGQVLPAIGAFLSKHQLPETAWSLRWGAADPVAKAEAYARTPCGLEAMLDVEVPREHLWAHPVRVSMLEPQAVIHLVRKRWLGKARVEPVRLDRMHVTAVTHMPEHAAFRFSESSRGPSPGVEVVLRTTASAHATARRIDVDGAALGPAETLGPEDTQVVHRLWARVEATICDLVCYRKKVTAATLRSVQIEEIVHPEVIAEVIVESIAPLVREMARRSSTEGELGLKRYLGDARREELFMTYDALLAGTDALLPRHRLMFEGYGLSESRTRGATVVPLLPPMPRLPQLRAVND